MCSKLGFTIIDSFTQSWREILFLTWRGYECFSLISFWCGTKAPSAPSPTFSLKTLLADWALGVQLCKITHPLTNWAVTSWPEKLPSNQTDLQEPVLSHFINLSVSIKQWDFNDLWQIYSVIVFVLFHVF